MTAKFKLHLPLWILVGVLFYPALALSLTIESNELKYSEDNIALFEGKPFTGMAISACFYFEAKTAKESGAEVRFDKETGTLWLYIKGERKSRVADACIAQKTIEFTEYVDGLRHGKYKAESKSGSTLATGSYLKGEKHGRWITYHNNGNVEFDRTHKNGRLDGKYYVYHENGALSLVQTWVAGRGLTGPTDYYDPCGQGNKQFTLIHDIHKLAEIHFDDRVIKCGNGWSSYKKNCMALHDSLRQAVGRRHSLEAKAKIEEVCRSDESFKIEKVLEVTWRQWFKRFF